MMPGSSGNGASAPPPPAPASGPGSRRTARRHCSRRRNLRGRVSVPTPTTASGTALRIASIAGRHAGVRSVTSSTRSPPALNARPSGTAWSICSIVRTGMTGASARRERIFTIPLQTKKRRRFRRRWRRCETWRTIRGRRRACCLEARPRRAAAVHRRLRNPHFERARIAVEPDDVAVVDLARAGRRPGIRALDGWRRAPRPTRPTCARR